MECCQAKSIISSYIDNLLSPGEKALMDRHLSACADCSRELALQGRLSGVLRAIGAEEAQAPPELCGMVMSKLRNERRTLIRFVPPAWRRTVAAAAAVLLLAFSSAGIMMNMDGSEKLIALHKPPEAQAPAHSNKTTATKTTKPNDPESAPVTPGKMQNTEAVSPDKNGGSHQKKSADTGEDKNTSQGPIGSTGNGSKVALLEKHSIEVISTNLKISTENLTEARARAVAAAASVDATVQVFTEQNNGKNIVIMRIETASERAPALTADLYKVGSMLDRRDESRDNTAFYNETLVKYTDLQSRLSKTTDPGERQQLTAQAASYKQTMDAKLAEAAKHVIILQLEEK